MLFLADVIAIMFFIIFSLGRCYSLDAYEFDGDGIIFTIWLMFSLCWQMLLPLFMAVGIAIMVVLPRFVPNLYMVCWQMLLPCG